jgi:hypothetical protein
LADTGGRPRSEENWDGSVDSYLYSFPLEVTFVLSQRFGLAEKRGKSNFVLKKYF